MRSIVLRTSSSPLIFSSIALVRVDSTYSRYSWSWMRWEMMLHFMVSSLRRRSSSNLSAMAFFFFSSRRA